MCGTPPSVSRWPLNDYHQGCLITWRSMTWNRDKQLMLIPADENSSKPPTLNLNNWGFHFFCEFCLKSNAVNHSSLWNCSVCIFPSFYSSVVHIYLSWIYLVLFPSYFCAPCQLFMVMLFIRSLPQMFCTSWITFHDANSLVHICLMLSLFAALQYVVVVLQQWSTFFMKGFIRYKSFTTNMESMLFQMCTIIVSTRCVY